MNTKKLLLLVFLLPSLFANAQTAASKIAVGVNYLKNEYNGEYGNGIFEFRNVWNPGVGISIQSYLNPSFDAGLQTSFGRYGFYDTNINQFQGNKFDASLFAHYKLNNGFILSESSILSPFLSLGVGFASYSENNLGIPFPTIITDKLDFILPVGAGLKLQLSDHLAIQYQYLYNFTSSDVHDQNRSGGTQNKIFGTPNNPALKNGNDAFGEHLVGIIFNFGKVKDTDNDGVADKYDMCKDTPTRVVVDAKGCPVDTDKDGVADYLDKCADTPVDVVVDAKGCPVDADNDGVADYLDKCSNTPDGVKVDANGCPIDGDNDGVPDYLDKCPTIAGLAKFDGCPDTDGDGISDIKDKCPTVAGLAQFDGCPDSDGDGVPDYLDKCPTVPGLKENRGCPEVKAETKKIFAQALLGIQFESGKDVIKKISNSILDKVVSVMKENTAYQLEINGHTDSQGDDAKNLLLSQARANAVKNYLVKGGVAADRLTAKGFGETMPVADNNTAVGKAKNRRVEFKVNF